jgi:hypothetical protein
VERAAGICAGCTQTIWDIEEPGEDVVTEAAVRDFMTESARIRTERRRELEGLVPPEDLGGERDDALALLQRQIDGFQGVADAIDRGEGIGAGVPETDFIAARASFERVAPDLGLAGRWAPDQDS